MIKSSFKTMKKPCNIKTITAKKAWFLLPSFRAITLFGVIYCKRSNDVNSINKTDYIDSMLKCHETIHVRQAENTKNSWLLFYLNYIWQWLCNLPLIFISLHYAYKFIPYELEAYANEDIFEYPYGISNQWRMFKKELTLKDKWKYAKEYKKSKMTFRWFIREHILPYINREA